MALDFYFISMTYGATKAKIHAAPAQNALDSV
jgi:hypothetical protein